MLWKVVLGRCRAGACVVERGLETEAIGIESRRILKPMMSIFWSCCSSTLSGLPADSTHPLVPGLEGEEVKAAAAAALQAAGRFRAQQEEGGALSSSPAPPAWAHHPVPRGRESPLQPVWREDFGGLALPASSRLARGTSLQRGPEEKELEKIRLQQMVQDFLKSTEIKSGGVTNTSSGSNNTITTGSAADEEGTEGGTSGVVESKGSGRGCAVVDFRTGRIFKARYGLTATLEQQQYQSNSVEAATTSDPSSREKSSGSGPMTLIFQFTTSSPNAVGTGSSGSSIETAKIEKWPLARIHNVYRAEESCTVKAALEQGSISLNDEELRRAVLLEFKNQGGRGAHLLRLILLDQDRKDADEHKDVFFRTIKILRLYSQALEPELGPGYEGALPHEPWVPKATRESQHKIG